MIELRVEPLTNLREHASIPNSFDALAVYDVARAEGEWSLVERKLDSAFHKDYDAMENPLSWPQTFDVSKWALVAAFIGSRRVGGAIVAVDTPGVDMLEGRTDLVVLWDIRVAAGARRQGVGAALFRAAQAWGREHDCRELKVETQDINVAACNLYRSQGCTLATVNAGAYPALPCETQLIWRKGIAR